MSTLKNRQNFSIFPDHIYDFHEIMKRLEIMISDVVNYSQMNLLGFSRFIQFIIFIVKGLVIIYDRGGIGVK